MSLPLHITKDYYIPITEGITRKFRTLPGPKTKPRSQQNKSHSPPETKRDQKKKKKEAMPFPVPCRVLPGSECSLCRSGAARQTVANSFGTGPRNRNLQTCRLTQGTPRPARNFVLVWHSPVPLSSCMPPTHPAEGPLPEEPVRRRSRPAVWEVPCGPLCISFFV